MTKLLVLWRHAWHWQAVSKHIHSDCYCFIFEIRWAGALLSSRLRRWSSCRYVSRGSAWDHSGRRSRHTCAAPYLHWNNHLPSDSRQAGMFSPSTGRSSPMLRSFRPFWLSCDCMLFKKNFVICFCYVNYFCCRFFVFSWLFSALKR